MQRRSRTIEDPTARILNEQAREERAWEALVDKKTKDALFEITLRGLATRERTIALFALAWGISEKKTKRSLNKPLALEAARIVAYGLPNLGLIAIGMKPDSLVGMTPQSILGHAERVAAAWAGGAGNCTMAWSNYYAPDGDMSKEDRAERPDIALGTNLLID